MEQFDNQRSPTRRPNRPRHTAEDRELAREERRRARVLEAEPQKKPNEPAAHARLPTDFAVRRRGEESEQE